MVTCRKCGETKEQSEFPRDKGKKSGFHSVCKACKRVASKVYFENNREKFRESGRRYYARHKEEVAARVRAYREANPDRKFQQEWRKKNPAKSTDYMRTRRARMRSGDATIPHVNSEDFWTGMCAICGHTFNADDKYPHPRSPSVDHIIPLSRGGTHTLENLQWACLDCNRRKSDRLPGNQASA